MALLLVLFTSPLAARQHPADGDQLLREAGKAAENGIPEVAVTKLQSYLESNPADDRRIQALELLCRNLLRSNQPEDALETAKQLPESPVQNFLNAEALMALGRTEEAAAAYRRTLDAPGQYSEMARIGLARAELARKNAEAALGVLDTIPADSPMSRHALHLRAEAMLEAGRPDETLRLLKEAAEGDATPSPKEEYLRARALYDSGRTEEARDAALEILEDARIPRPIHTGATLLAAEASAHTGNTDQAENLVEGFIDAQPDSPHLTRAFRIFSNLYQDRMSAAAHQLRLWVVDGSGRREAFARLLLAESLLDSDNASEARQFLESLVAPETEPSIRLEATLRLADLHARNGETERAMEILDTGGDAQWPTASQARLLFKKGEILQAAGEAESAASLFSQAAAINPELGSQALFNEAQSQLAAGDFDSFLETYAEFSRRYPESRLRSDLVLEEGLLQARQGNADGEQTLRVFIRDFPKHPRIAEAYLALAESAFLELDPDLETASQFLATARKAELDNTDRQRAEFLGIQLADANPDIPDSQTTALANDFLENFPESDYADEVRFKVGEIHFRNGDYPRAQTAFEKFAEKNSGSPHLEKAYYLAAESSLRTMNPEGLERAFELFESAARLEGPLRGSARIGQAKIKARQGDHGEAVRLYREILQATKSPEVVQYATLGMGESLYAQGSERPGAYAEAADLFLSLSQRDDLPATLRNQALWKAGQSLEKAGNPEKALEAYYDAFASSPDAEGDPEYFWFYKAAFDAGRILESRQKWTSAIGIYRKLASLDGPRAAEAKQRMERLQLEHFIWEG